MARARKQQEKLDRRNQRQRQRDDRLSASGIAEGEDPDIAGIVPGPQPPLEE